MAAICGYLDQWGRLQLVLTPSEHVYTFHTHIKCQNLRNYCNLKDVKVIIEYRILWDIEVV